MKDLTEWEKHTTIQVILNGRMTVCFSFALQLEITSELFKMKSQVCKKNKNFNKLYNEIVLLDEVRNQSYVNYLNNDLVNILKKHERQTN